MDNLPCLDIIFYPNTESTFVCVLDLSGFSLDELFVWHQSLLDEVVFRCALVSAVPPLPRGSDGDGDHRVPPLALHVPEEADAPPEHHVAPDH